MAETNPGKILQLNGIEVSPNDKRSSEQILQEYMAAGLIALRTEIEVVPQESTL